LEPVGGTAGLEPIGHADGMEPVGGASQPPAQQLPRKRIKTNVWDSKLLLVGGGALILMIITGVALYFLLTRGTAAELFQAAEEDYHSEAYAQAIAKYEKFLDRYPKDPNVSLARVKIGTARLWQAVDGSRDKRVALKAAGEVLPNIEQEEKFSEARPELASILPEIAEGFSTQAKSEQNIEQAEELVGLAEEAMVLVNAPKYIPTSLRVPIQATVNRILEDIELAKRNINRTKRLDEAVKIIRDAAREGNTVKAYDERRALLNEYPELEKAPPLLEVVLLITERERDLVKVVDSPVEPSTEDHSRAQDLQVTLASRSGKGAPGSENQTVFFLARGTVYGLQATTGKVLWRRFVGYDTLAHPQPLAQQAGADVIVVDGHRSELLRLQGQTGKLVWRLPIGEPFSDPVVYGKRILVATDSGRVLNVDAESGASPKQVVIPQKLQVPPGTSKLRHLYQVGEHSNLYVLDEETLECKEVFYLGHKPGTVATPPVMALGHLFVAVNSGEDYCELHVLAVDENGLKLKRAMKPMRLGGRIMVTPLLTGARVGIVTDLGAIHLFEVNAANPEQPVLDAVEPQVASFRTPMIGYSVIDGGRLYVGNDRLTKYEVQTSQARLISKWIKFERDTFVAPPQVIGDTVYHIRRRKDSPSYTVSAIHVDDGRELWRVDLATPAALLAVSMEKKQIDCVSAQAELFEITSEAFQTGILDQMSVAAVGAARTVAFNEAIPMSDGRWALASPNDGRRVVVYDPNSVSTSGRLQARPLKAVGDANITTSPVYFSGGLLMPLDNGQVLLVDPETGDHKVLPFQARVEGGAKIRWHRPSVIGADAAEFVIGDGGRKLYRVGIKDQPKPHLSALAQAQLKVDIVSALASAGDTVYAVVRGSGSDTVVSFAAADLSVGSEWPLEGRVVWGPEQVGDVVLLASNQDGLLCFESGQKQRWKGRLDYGPPVARPLEQDNSFVFTSLSGVIWRVSSEDGSEAQKTDLGAPLGSIAVPFDGRNLLSVPFGDRNLLLSGSDGTLHIIPALTGT
jgi:outer membrane protein assembly factor BamB